jgi:hypothetical protein
MCTECMFTFTFLFTLCRVSCYSWPLQSQFKKLQILPRVQLNELPEELTNWCSIMAANLQIQLRLYQTVGGTR